MASLAGSGLNTDKAQGNKDYAYLKRVRILNGGILSGFYCILEPTTMYIQCDHRYEVRVLSA